MSEGRSCVPSLVAGAEQIQVPARRQDARQCLELYCAAGCRTSAPLRSGIDPRASALLPGGTRTLRRADAPFVQQTAADGYIFR